MVQSTTRVSMKTAMVGPTTCRMSITMIQTGLMIIDEHYNDMCDESYAIQHQAGSVRWTWQMCVC
jgi:hypothetical protein